MVSIAKISPILNNLSQRSFRILLLDFLVMSIIGASGINGTEDLGEQNSGSN